MRFFSRIFSMLLPDEVAGVGVQEGGYQRRSSDACAWLEAKFFASFTFHFVVEHPYRDVDRTGTFALAAVGASSGQVHGARQEIGDIFGTHRRALDPADAIGFFRRRSLRCYREGDAVHDTLFAVAHRAHRAACKAAHAAVEMVAPDVPALAAFLCFETGQRGKRFRQLASCPVFAEYKVVFPGKRDAAFQAPIRHHVAGRQSLLPFRSGDYEIVAVEGGKRSLGAIQLCGQLAFVEHTGPLAGHADDVHVLALEVVFLQQHDDGTGVASLGDDSDRRTRILAEVGQNFLVMHQVQGQVVIAGWIPYQLVSLFGAGDECGLGGHAAASPPVADDGADFALREHIPRRIADILNIDHARSAFLNFCCGPSGLRSLTKSVTTWANLAPSAADTHDIRNRFGSTPMN